MLEQYYRISQAAGIALTIQADGSADLRACTLTASNKELDIDKRLTGSKTVTELAKSLPKGTLTALNISGKGVLYRQIERTDEITAPNFNKVLPNASFNDFYIQNFISGEHSFIAVIRKTEANRWISQLNEAGCTVLALSLGPFAVDQILSQLNFYGTELQFDGHDIRLDEQKNWHTYQHNPLVTAAFAIKVDQEQLHEKLVIAYAAAFQLILATRVDLIQADVEPLQSALKKKLDQLKLRAQGFVILAVFFALLLINFITLSSLNSANAALQGQVSRSAQNSTDVEQLGDQVKQKEALLQVLGWDGGINKSALIDQVASMLPPEVKWTEASLNPIDLAASRIEKTPVFYSRRIRITGTSEKIIPVNEWMARVKTAKWVKHIQMDSYAFNSELNTGQFTIIIDY